MCNPCIGASTVLRMIDFVKPTCSYSGHIDSQTVYYYLILLILKCRVLCDIAINVYRKYMLSLTHATHSQREVNHKDETLTIFLHSEGVQNQFGVLQVTCSLKYQLI